MRGWLRDPFLNLPEYVIGSEKTTLMAVGCIVE